MGLSAKRIRLAIYDHFIKTGHSPTPAALSQALALPETDIRAGLQALHDRHLIRLAPGGERVQMAWPFSAVETPYRIQHGETLLHANCAWDLFGIVAILGIDADLEAPCAQTGEKLPIRVENQRIASGSGVVQFLTPPADWHVDVVHT